jgi:hypothetical protein
VFLNGCAPQEKLKEYLLCAARRKTSKDADRFNIGITEQGSSRIIPWLGGSILFGTIIPSFGCATIFQFIVTVLPISAIKNKTAVNTYV